MKVTFDNIQKGKEYSRNDLVKLWGYTGRFPLDRGVVTPANENLIILFVTKEKHKSAEQYKDDLKGDTLDWEGPTDHGSEDRMVNSNNTEDQIHLFYRDRWDMNFTYEGQFVVERYQLNADRPSKFVMKRK